MEPQRLKAIQGWAWIKQGYALFKKAPLLWIVLLFICIVAALTLSSVPVVGEYMVSLLMPVLLVGLMAGCRALSQDEELELVHLFSGFKQHASPLVTLGGISLLAQFLILGAMKMTDGNALVELWMSKQPGPDDFSVVMQAVADAPVAATLGVVLFSSLMMAMQYAPMLVYFRNVPPLHALRLSFSAFLYNVGAMLVYALTFMLLAILASLPMFLGWLILLPLTFTSLYASYSDIFPPLKADVDASGDVISRDDQSTF